MSHARKQIRDAVVTALAVGVASVQATRVYPVTDDDMPAYLVYTTGEEIDPQMSTGQGIARVLTLTVEAVDAQAVDTLDDAMDAHAVFIEGILQWATLGGLVQRTRLLRSELLEKADTDRPVAILILTFDVLYRTLPANPEIIV